MWPKENALCCHFMGPYIYIYMLFFSPQFLREDFQYKNSILSSFCLTSTHIFVSTAIYYNYVDTHVSVIVIRGSMACHFHNSLQTIKV